MRVYKFGVLAPAENADLVTQQMRLAHRYYNNLVQIENGRRAAQRLLSIDAASTAAQAEVDAQDERCRATVARIKAERVNQKSRHVDPALGAELEMARHARKVAVAVLKAARKVARAKKIAEAKLINAAALDLLKNARYHCGVYWGTYLLVEQAVAAAADATNFAADLSYKRWAGEGTIGVQVQDHSDFGPGADGGEVVDLTVRERRKLHRPRKAPRDGAPPPKREPAFTVERLYDGAHKSSKWLRIDLAEHRGHLAADECGPVSSRSQHREYAVLRVRVGPRGSPTVVEFPMLQHRQIPAGVVKRATVNLRRVADREEWYATLSVAECPRETRCGEGAVAVHLGWLSTPEGTRVGNWLDENGSAGRLIAPARTPQFIGDANAIESTRDMYFDATRVKFAAASLSIRRKPVWIVEALRWMPQWKSQARLARLFRVWERFDGDETAYDIAREWYHRDRHLWQYAAGRRRRALNHREYEYRKFAAGLARRYSVLVVDDAKYSTLQEREAPDGVKVRAKGERRDGTDRAVTQRDAVEERRRTAAPGELREILVNAFRARGGKVVIVPANGVSTACPVCARQSAEQRGEDAGGAYFACASGCYEGDSETTALLNALLRAGYVDRVREIIAQQEAIRARVRGAAE